MNYIDLFIGIIVGAALGFLITYLILKMSKSSLKNFSLQAEKNQLEKTVTDVTREKQNLKNQLEDLSERLSDIKSRNAEIKERESHLNEKLNKQKKEMEEKEEQMNLQFQNLANKIFDEKSEKFVKKNKESIDVILNPLKEKIKDFEQKVEKVYGDENKERISLKSEIKHLVELNKKLSEEANNLATALKGDNKTQGNWGELVLEKVLESSGLKKGREYEMQYAMINEDGRRHQPDVIVNLPENKHIVIDAKVSVVAYEKFINATDKNEKENYLKDHVTSVKSHIKNLGEKNYQHNEKLITPDFVLLFIPIESALGSAAGSDENLWNYGWERKIVLVSPATLSATLRTVASIWKHENQNINAFEIARQAGNMLDKFSAFTDDMLNIGQRMDLAKKSYESAMNKLVDGKDNLIRKSEKLRDLGVKSKKKLDQRLLDRALEDNLLEFENLD